MQTLAVSRRESGTYSMTILKEDAHLTHLKKMLELLGELSAPFAWGKGNSVVEGLLSLAGPQHWFGPRCREGSEEENKIL